MLAPVWSQENAGKKENRKEHDLTEKGLKSEQQLDWSGRKSFEKGMVLTVRTGETVDIGAGWDLLGTKLGLVWEKKWFVL